VNEWWRGLAPAQATVDCGGARHQLRWENGALHAVDHGDAESERTLAALGGQSCTCLDLIEAWERHHEDVRVFVLGSRGPMDVLAVAGGAGAGLGGAQPRTVTRSSGWTSYAPLGRVPRPPVRMSREARAEAELLALLGLGGGLPERLLASEPHTAEWWSGRRGDLEAGSGFGMSFARGRFLRERWVVAPAYCPI
jgi:hypothetical protein